MQQALKRKKYSACGRWGTFSTASVNSTHPDLSLGWSASEKICPRSHGCASKCPHRQLSARHLPFPVAAGYSCYSSRTVATTTLTRTRNHRLLGDRSRVSRGPSGTRPSLTTDIRLSLGVRAGWQRARFCSSNAMRARHPAPI